MDEEASLYPLSIDVIVGKDLPESYIQLMESRRIKEYGKNTKDFRQNERDSLFFFLKDHETVKAFGMLKPVTLYYEDRQYPILGIANVMALEKSKGLGTALMREITQYLIENSLAGVGNTHKDNFEFYKKCGYTFIPGLLERLVYVTSDGEELRTNTQDYDLFVFDPRDSLRNLIGGDQQIIIKVPFW